MKVKIIKAPAGLGKTSMVLKQLRTATYGTAEIYVPTHKLAEEISALLSSGTAPVSNVVIRGRGHEPVAGEPMCKKHLQAAELSRKGWPVTPLLCVRSAQGWGTMQCAHYDTCPYIAQFSKTAKVLIYTHASLPLNRGVLESKAPDIAIIDESFWATCTSLCEIPLSDLFKSPTCDGMRDSHCTAKVLELIGTAVQTGKPLLEVLRESGGAALIEKAIGEVDAPVTVIPIRPSDSTSAQIKAAGSVIPRKEVLCLLRALQAEIKVSRPESHCVMWVPTKQLIQVCYRQPITRFDTNTKALILDANADPGIIAQWFPGAEFVSIPADRNVFVIQCKDSRVSTISLAPHPQSTPDFVGRAKKRLGELDKLIAREAGGGRKVLVVGPQAVTGNPAQKIDPLLKAPADVVFAHFGGIRGLDQYKDFDTVIIVGRNEPALKAAEASARAIYFDAVDPLEWADDWSGEVRGYRLRDRGKSVGIEVPVHPDRRVQGVVDQIRESETTQAIDRLRHVHSSVTKRVFIMSSIPVDIEVDLLLGWYDIVYGPRLVQALERLDGVLPLDPNWLAEKFPDLWKSPEAARASVREVKQTGETVNNISIYKTTSLFHDYWLGGQRGQPQIGRAHV